METSMKRKVSEGNGTSFKPIDSPEEAKRNRKNDRDDILTILQDCGCGSNSSSEKETVFSILTKHYKAREKIFEQANKSIVCGMSNDESSELSDGESKKISDDYDKVKTLFCDDGAGFSRPRPDLGMWERAMLEKGLAVCRQVEHRDYEWNKCIDHSSDEDSNLSESD